MTPASIDKRKLSRFIAAYKLRLAEKAKEINAQPETWRGRPISADEERKHLSPQDRFRCTPYPYPGLRSFAPDEGGLFFGREKNVEALRTILARRRLVVVLGGSGSGKSSLVRAGLLPFLNTKRRIEGRDGNWYIAEFRPRTDPFGELAIALVNKLLLPLLKLRRKGLAEAMGLPADADCEAESTIKLLQDRMRQRFMDAKKAGRQQVLNTVLQIADQELDLYDRIATRGTRLAEPNLFLLVDQLEEVFRPEIAEDEREALLDLIVDLHAHMRDPLQRGGLFLAATIRSEEVHRCAEHRGLSEVVIGSGYQIELLDPENTEDVEDLRQAIIEPARKVFNDWGLSEHLDHGDAPFAEGMPALLLKGAARLSDELDHQADQLPLLQHALQATWHSAIRRWSDPEAVPDKLEIAPEDLPQKADAADQTEIEDREFPDLSLCLEVRADRAKIRAAERFAEIAGSDAKIGTDALRAAFRALARRDDQGNWARRFAGEDEITSFLEADPTAAVAQLPDDKRWRALQEALHVFLLRGYLSQGNEQKYDISHEALIRNWRLFQEWLRDPLEVAYALGRVLQETNPKEFAEASADKKMRLIPRELARRVRTVAEGGPLPTRWGEDQIQPYLLRSALRRQWGSDKHEALKQLTRVASIADEERKQAEEAAIAARQRAAEQLAAAKQKEAEDNARREAVRVRNRTLSAGALMAGILIFAGVYSNQRSQTEITKAKLEATAASERAAKAEALDAVLQAKVAAAYNLMGAQNNWPNGTRERAVLHVLDMLSDKGGQLPPQGFLRASSWRYWDSNARAMLGEFRIARLKELSGNSPLSCLSFRETSPQTAVAAQRVPEPTQAVLLAGAPKTEIRLSTPSSTGSGPVFFETREDGGEWTKAIHENGNWDMPAGTRLCLTPNGSGVIISLRGSPYPNPFELQWSPCQEGCKGSKWRVSARQIRVSPQQAASGRPFSCVRSIKIQPRSKESFSRIEVDFTDELIDECDGPLTGNPKINRGRYFPGVSSAMLDAGIEKPSKFSDCKAGDAKQRVCELTGKDGKLNLVIDRASGSSVWSMRVVPLDVDYPISGMTIVAPSIEKIAVGTDKSIWLTDGKDHFWVLNNDRDTLVKEMWRGARALYEESNWVEKLPQELRQLMTEEDVKKRPVGLD